ncbi:hypothetical protein BDR06DRAFT_1061210, partial [Suillus hirtellus]
LFFVNTLQINYTSYNLQCQQDLINPHNHADIMVLSGDSESCSTHPYWYARVLRIFHVNVLDLRSSRANPQKTLMEILFVRWFDPVWQYRSGNKAARLPKFAFVPEMDNSAFGFVDPALVICGVHLIPAFADGCMRQFVPQQNSAQCAWREDDVWTAYYVNMFVDHDMFIQFIGAGIGHGPWQVDGPSNDKPGKEDELGDRENQDSQMGEDECKEESEEDQNENENENENKCKEESEEDENEEDENECKEESKDEDECEESEDDNHIEDTSLSGSDTDEDVNF